MVDSESFRSFKVERSLYRACGSSATLDLAAGEDGCDRIEDGDNTLRDKLAIDVARAVRERIAYIDDGLDDSDDGVHNCHEAARNGVHHAFEL